MVDRSDMDSLLALLGRSPRRTARRVLMTDSVAAALVRAGRREEEGAPPLQVAPRRVGQERITRPRTEETAIPLGPPPRVDDGWVDGGPTLPLLDFNGLDRRELERVRIDTAVSWTDDAARTRRGRARDMSRSGMRVASRETLPRVGCLVTLRMILELDQVEHVVGFAARVVRHADPAAEAIGFAASFVAVDEMGMPGLVARWLDAQ